MYIDGRKIKPKYCLDCKKRIWYQSIKCKSCEAKIHGNSRLPYSIDFNNKLKQKIRERDNFECQNCVLKETDHINKYNQKLHVHHIDYDKMNSGENNLITLCKRCNIQANHNIDYWFAYYTYKMEKDYELN